MLQAYRAKPMKQPHKVIHMIDADPEYENDIERIRDLLVYTIAGHDTSSNAIAFALYELAKNSNEQTKLRNILQKCASDDEAYRCPELKYVMRETLRLRPPVAIGIARVCGQEFVFERKYNGKPVQITIPRGFPCLTSFYAIQRDENVFANPDTFDPSRWASPSEEMNKALLPFAIGPRNCQGQALANAEISVVLSKLCRKYEFGIIEEGRAATIVFYKPVGTILSVKAV
mmetsp:Transcript_11561/g.16858  ORF Transcript_11561/g.16858 Transcript_11561/m.16858 type:complete len:230 (+) Transcript_11561:48-737(+)